MWNREESLLAKHLMGTYSISTLKLAVVPVLFQRKTWTMLMIFEVLSNLLTFLFFFPADPWFARYGFYSKWRLIKSIFRPAVSKLGRWGPYSVLACRAYLGAHCAHTPTYVIWCCLYFLWRQNITLPYPVGRMSDTILFAFWEVCIVWWKFIMPDCP